MNYIIYKVENKIDGTIYIGGTTRKLEARKNEHIQVAFNNGDSLFYKDICTYGPESFSWESIDTASTNNELAQKEVHYISEYGQYSKLYNQDRGGGITKNIYQYDRNSLNLVATYSSLEEAAISIGSDKKTISNTCLSVNKYLKGYYWTYDYTETFVKSGDKRQKKVLQLTLNGEFIKDFSSVADASRYCNINKTSIAKVCRNERKSAGGYIWQYQ
ncbi:MAG: GIY-YIG nuclease family protein [Winogradskyella sp.]|uniref:NUMOD1 domain-containing DNA-binding protein n=1 Tax=Winogradskyella sp. TaxID=1883156 RepID=UPI0025F048D6|nr:NUMOD1 domain-containing DNA-binding protein [Winogradskyella sp.]NRB58321.1 GIY-YIG nuclease family protein [Winogradskyella sp.]